MRLIGRARACAPEIYHGDGEKVDRFFSSPHVLR